MALESRLVPIMREAVEVVKMILFRELKQLLVSEQVAADLAGMLAGGVVNQLFGTPNASEPFASFVRENQARIDDILTGLPGKLDKMRIPLTDGLRMQFLCDSMEGQEDAGVLERARQYGVLISDRDMPLPHHFIELVRRLGKAHGLLVLPEAGEPPAEPQA